MEIKIFKNKKIFKKGGMHTDPGIYWGVSLLAAFLIILSSVAFSFYLFIKINKELVVVPVNNSQAEAVNKERIDKILEYFSTREKRSTEILNSPPPVIDPSL